jgi:hypothetical protein
MGNTVSATVTRTPPAGTDRHGMWPAWLGIFATIMQRWLRTWLAIALLVPPGFYVGQVVLLRVRFGHWPNYVTFYDWPANVARIVRSTPSIWDTIALIRDEWLFETGFINKSYGRGIAEWSMTIIPEHFLYVVLLGILLATNIVLLLERSATANPIGASCAGAATGVGGSLLGLSNVSLTWALCCGSPNWAVALTFMGFGSTSALWLVPYAPVLAWTGFALLLLPSVLLLRDIMRRAPAAPRS